MADKEAMQMALDALYENTTYSMQGDPVTYQDQRNDDTIEALRAALAQPEPEPVAWMHNFIDYVITKNRPTDITRNAGRWTPLYTAPPAKEWAGLTDDEYELMAEKRVTNYFFNTLDYAHDIEAKLKGKNT